jgi:hypothetical protein
MADQAALDRYAGQIIGRREDGQDRLGDLWNKLIEIQGATTFLTAALRDVKGYNDDANYYSYAQAFESVCTRLVDVVYAVRRIEAAQVGTGTGAELTASLALILGAVQRIETKVNATDAKIDALTVTVNALAIGGVHGNPSTIAPKGA